MAAAAEVMSPVAAAAEVISPMVTAAPEVISSVVAAALRRPAAAVDGRAWQHEVEPKYEVAEPYMAV